MLVLFFSQQNLAKGFWQKSRLFLKRTKSYFKAIAVSEVGITINGVITVLKITMLLTSMLSTSIAGIVASYFAYTEIRVTSLVE